MPFSKGTRLPGESASKLGHLSVIKSKWVKDLVESFERISPEPAPEEESSWTTVDPTQSTALKSIWVVDGSFVPVRSSSYPFKEVAFVKTALLTLDRDRIAELDKEYPHPLLLQDILAESGLFHATVFPLSNIKTSKGNNYEAVRNIVRDSLMIDEDGAFYETLKWIAYRKWSRNPTKSPEFSCPHCLELHPGLPFDADETSCPHCQQEVYLSDMIGIHLDMNEESAPEAVASAYMQIMETLMLFTPVRLLWYHTDKNVLSDTLFIKDGPLSLWRQYSKLVDPIREFLEYAKKMDRAVHIIGQEKSGHLLDHLRSIVSSAPPKDRGDIIAYKALSHSYVHKEVQRSPILMKNLYGLKTNWGEKLYVKFDPGTYMVLNVPTGLYLKDQDSPTSKDLVGLGRILATVPDLISHKFEGALYPIELANGIASLSSYPSAAILQKFMDDSR